MSKSEASEQEWKKLGQGSYNTAYVSKDGKSVLKIQREPDKTDTPERSVRLWNAINSHYPPPAVIKETKEYGKGWICPFIKGEQASDNEMKHALIDTYIRSGRIVVDAMAPKNFVRTPQGQVVCVDIGMALQIERREDFVFHEAVRRKSVVSLETWQDLSKQYMDYFSDRSDYYPQTVNTVKALLFIKNNRPDMYDVSFLLDDSTLLSRLSIAYDLQSSIKRKDAVDDILKILDEAEQDTFKLAKAKAISFITHNRPDIVDKSFLEKDRFMIHTLASAHDLQTTDGDKADVKEALNLLKEKMEKQVFEIENIKGQKSEMKLAMQNEIKEKNLPEVKQIIPNEIKSAKDDLEKIRPLTLANIKVSCIKELEKYINSRGSFKDEKFVGSLVTRIFRNVNLTANKAYAAKALIGVIEKSDNLQSLEKAIKEYLSQPDLVKAKFSSGLESSLGKCLLMVEAAKGADLKLQHEPLIEQDSISLKK